MRRLVALLAIALTSCAQPSAKPVVHVSPSASPQALATPQFTDLPLSTVSFSCRLPIYTDGSVIEDSFLTFPDGAISPTPVGSGGLYFDRAFSRWLPVPRSAVSPDGISYAYIEVGQEPDVFVIHMVGVFGDQRKDVAVQESASAAGFGAQPQVFDYSADGIYLTEAFEHVWPGVWRFDQRTQTIQKLADVEVPEVSSSGVIWYGAVNPADPNPFSSRSSAGIFPNEVDRLDLKTGTRARWLYRPGAAVNVMGVDTLGRPVIIHTVPGSDPGIGNPGFFDHSQSELLLGLDAAHQRSIYKGQLVETLGNPIADSHGVWFGSAQGIYLYSDAGGLQKVSDHPGYPANGCF
jgi:hypothetical protein